MSPSRWRRRVSPIFMVLLVVAGLAIGFLVYQGLILVLLPSG